MHHVLINQSLQRLFTVLPQFLWENILKKFSRSHTQSLHTPGQSSLLNVKLSIPLFVLLPQNPLQSARLSISSISSSPAPARYQKRSTLLFSNLYHHVHSLAYDKCSVNDIKEGHFNLTKNNGLGWEKTWVLVLSQRYLTNHSTTFTFTFLIWEIPFYAYFCIHLLSRLYVLRDDRHFTYIISFSIYNNPVS